jgi:hypothetical protein
MSEGPAGVSVAATKPANPFARSFLLGLCGAAVGGIVGGFFTGGLIGFILNPMFQAAFVVEALAASCLVAGVASYRRHRVKAWIIVLASALLTGLLFAGFTAWYVMTVPNHWVLDLSDLLVRYASV